MRARSVVLPAALSLVVIGVTGCSVERLPLVPDASRDAASLAVLEVAGDPAAPVARGREFFPLAPGNRWVYAGRQVLTMIPDGGDPLPPERTRFRVRTRIVCRETIADRHYLVAREVFDDGQDQMKTWIRWRQDRDGLYEADVPLQQPPACEGDRAAREPAAPAVTAEAMRETPGVPASDAAWAEARARAWARLDEARRLLGDGAQALASPEGIPSGGEVTRLAYPLHDGARWWIRREARLSAHVVGHEVLDLPAGRLPAWKVRLRAPWFGPGDRLVMWVGRQGFLKQHIEVTATAEEPPGTPIGIVHLREVRELKRYELAGPGIADAAPEPAAGFTPVDTTP